MKRLFDILISFIGLTVLFPLFIVVSILIKLDSKGPVFFLQKRVGKNFREFKIVKFRSMVADSERQGPRITVGGDKRVTRVGKYLRKYKIDELPQLINVLRGEMSFVGPRPEVKKYVELFKSDYEKILKIRPGITDPASIEYSDEESILSASTNWEEDYVSKVLPEKIRLSSQYVNNQKNIFHDMMIITRTIFKM